VLAIADLARGPSVAARWNPAQDRGQGRRADQDYYDQLISPLITGNPLVEFIGEIGDHEKSDFLSARMGLLLPIDWPEPFGLVDDRGPRMRHARGRL